VGNRIDPGAFFAEVETVKLHVLALISAKIERPTQAAHTGFSNETKAEIGFIAKVGPKAQAGFRFALSEA